MKLRLANPEHLIDINDLDELSYIRHEGDVIRIGALTRHVELLESELLAEHFPVFRDAEEVIADPVVRNRGTIGGSLCQADPGEDLSSVCSALKAEVVIRGPRGVTNDRDGRVSRRALCHRGRRGRDAHRGQVVAEARMRAARTRRSNGAPATSRSRPRRPRSGSMAARSGTPASRSAPSARRRSRSPGQRSCCAERSRRRSCSPRPGRSPPRTARPARTAGARSTTSAT